ncbi:sterol 3-beta-glucosyltransferase UGT80B1-like [Salvia miltiorrhiza]|uniref:sterol 3-beta-glucosyltransferase UGT80B1-like n=1 Tax=Salvia miltiorrhiza TaxID=226208 RepID=UPI0025AC6D0F|nr:sterol 3-beta-glucosyltransferase UGT80B1-like [Salvia miltiorrhiza]XP_057795451.1 sterol 3-beta-glucosyltransferase UGT80B1-like [Salvia miltiorrhiza]
MDGNGIDNDTKALETGVERSQEESNSTNQIHDRDVTLTLRERQDEGDSIDGSSNDRPDNQYMDGEFDLPSTPLANIRQTNLSQSSSAVEVSSVNDLSLSPLSRVRKGLDHCITAPVQRNLFIENEELAFSRSMTEKRMGSPLSALKLDRLSERQKKKLIVEIVKIQRDGTVEVDLTKDSPVASELLELQQFDRVPSTIDYIVTDHNKSVPKLKIAVLVVGTRGDVQPFLAVARRLQAYGHHVRLATHSNFRGFVKSAGVDFYPLGGDPRVLAGYMARNKGLIPSAPGEIAIQRKQIKAIIESLLPACTEPDLITGEPFRAQAIIANPPAYGHAHVAEALGVPMHIFFTMPWTPTYAFPHPLARVPQSAGYWLSYILVDLLIWWGIRGLINEFRRNKLKLPPIAYFSSYHGSISHLPTGYMWSPHVVPKPNDWGNQVDVVGYCFLNLGSKYQPSEEFSEWIQKGSQPIYIGFGSMPLDDSNKTTKTILEALEITGQRGIIDRGWGDLGNYSNIPENVFVIVDCPHDWLFPLCSAVVHHGGAGTTATGLKAGCPTTIVPFFGDQFFWGEVIYQKGLGPAPIPISQLTVESLTEAIRLMLQPEVKSRAMEIEARIESEDGVGAAVDAFHRNLPAEVPLPPPSPPPEKDDGPNPLQWFFTQIGRICCLPCGS